VIASVPFADGISRLVYQKPDARQFVIGQDGEPIYGNWCPSPEEVETAIIVIENRPTQP
jgi:hypothetical protein